MASALPLLLPVVGHTAGFALLEQSASRLGNAFSGTAATAEDATAMFFNPAALTRLDTPQVVAVASGIYVSSEFRDSASTPALGQPLGGDGGNAGGWNFLPSAYVSTPLGERLALGFGVNVPFGLELDYDDDWIGRFQALRSSIETVNLNPALAWRIGERLSIGVGVNHQYIDAELSNAVNYTAAIAQGLQQLAAAGQIPAAAVPGLVAANGALQGRVVVSGDDWAWGYNLGVLFELSDATTIGLSYRSTLKYTVTGTAAFTRPQVAEPIGAGIVALASTPGGPLADGPVQVDLELPDMAILSLRQALGARVELLADIAWTGWSSIQELDIVRSDTGETLSLTPEHWDDTWRFALGLSYELRPDLRLRGGVAYDEAPVPGATRTPRLPDADRRWLAIGAQWRATDALTLDFGYAHLFQRNVRLEQDAGNAAVNAMLDGTQRSSVDIVALQAAVRF